MVKKINTAVRISKDFDMIKSYRLTVTVPARVREDMYRIGNSVNWSNVAEQAFEKTISKLKELEGMDKIVARLKESKQRFDDAEKKKGYEDGQFWATNRAEYWHLTRLAARQLSDEWENLIQTVDGIVKIIADGESDAVMADASIYGVADRDEFSPEYLEAFVDGALDVWDTIESQLD